MRVPGILAARIDHTENLLLPENPSIRENAETVKNIATSIIKSDEYVGGGTMVDAVCRTLCCNMFSDRYLPANTTDPDCSLCRSLLLDLLKVKDGHMNIPGLSTEPVGELHLSYASKAMQCVGDHS